MKNTEFVKAILSHACGMLTPEEVKQNRGFQKYHIELHCRSFTVEARTMPGGDWDIRSCEMNTECRKAS